MVSSGVAQDGDTDVAAATAEETAVSAGYTREEHDAVVRFEAEIQNNRKKALRRVGLLGGRRARETRVETEDGAVMVAREAAETAEPIGQAARRDLTALVALGNSLTANMVDLLEKYGVRLSLTQWNELLASVSEDLRENQCEAYARGAVPTPPAVDGPVGWGYAKGETPSED